MGTHFYAFEAQGVVPDIVVLGKPIGNGYPLGAVVTTPEIAASFDNGMEFFSTFGGSTVSCAVGLAVLDVASRRAPAAHAAAVGARLLDRSSAGSGAPRACWATFAGGLFLGVELVGPRDPGARDRGGGRGRQPDARAAILIGTEGPFDNVLKIRPPMPFGEDDVDLLIRELDEALYGVMSGR